jgi:hypothetical protein
MRVKLNWPADTAAGATPVAATVIGRTPGIGAGCNELRNGLRPNDPPEQDAALITCALHSFILGLVVEVHMRLDPEQGC